MSKKIFLRILIVIIIIFACSLSLKANASHSWGNYHWARTANPFNIKIGNNVSSIWATNLSLASTDWNLSSVLDTSIVTGLSGRNCKAVNGRVEVCNAKYGNNGWLGIAQIWVNGDHITQGVVKLNDTYFGTAKYNNQVWRQFVVCQEVGHTFGLDHQDEVFDNSNLGTCMDYTNDPSRNDGLGNNLHPNTHDYDELALIYSHLDSTNTISQTTTSTNHGNSEEVLEGIDLNNPSSWGQSVREDARGNSSVFEKNIGNNDKIFTFVVWTE